MQISIKSDAGEIINIEWEQSDTLESIADKIQEKTEIPPSQQCWNLKVTKAKFEVKGILPTEQEMQYCYNSQNRDIDIDFLENLDLSEQLAKRKANIVQGQEHDWELVERDKQLSFTRDATSQRGETSRNVGAPMENLGSSQLFQKIVFEIKGPNYPHKNVMRATRSQVMKEYPGVKIEYGPKKNKNKNQNGWRVELTGCTTLLVPKERFMQLVNKK